MEKNVKLLIFLIITMAFTSCDPMRILVIKSKQNTSVTIYANQAMTNQTTVSNQKTIIRIPSLESPSKTDTTFYFGLGGWGNSDLIKNLSKKIDSIIIIDNHEKILLKNQSEINAYLMKRRGGYAKRKLIIEAK